MKGRIIFGASGDELTIVSSGTKEEYIDSHRKAFDEKYKPFKVTLSNGKTLKLRITDSGVLNNEATKFHFSADDITENHSADAPAHAPGGRCSGNISFE